MGLKNQLTKTPYLVLFIVLISIGVGTASALITITLSGDVVITGFLDMTGDKIANVDTPTLASDAATKAYVDSAPGTDTLASLGCDDTNLAQLVGSVWTCVNLTLLNNPITLVETLPDFFDGEDFLTTSAVHISIAIGMDGNPVISYQDEERDDLKVAHCGNSSCSSGNTITTVVSVGEVGAGSSIVIGADGLPVISYADDGNNHIKVVHCGNISCSSGNTITIVDSSTGTGNAPTSIAIGTDDNPVITYRDFFGGGLPIIHCGDPDCSETVNDNTKTIIEASIDAIDTHIAIGSDGFPVIAYHNDDFNFDDLKFVHCTNVPCTTFDAPITLDSTGNVGVSNSIAIDVNGNPVISYRGPTLDELKVVRCGNASCSAGITINTIGSNQVGGDSSIVIGANGLPVIGFVQDNTGEARIVKCGNDLCSLANSIFVIDNSGMGSIGSLSMVIGMDGNPVISYGMENGAELRVAVLGPVVILE